MWSDFIGFTFDGVHSSELNILRVSDGDRYNETILPEHDDKTVEAEGKDGVYYYGSFYKSREIEIQIAFDSVTEKQYRDIRRLFGQKKICKLIFDERPYKVYYVKIASPITLETICFDEDEYYWESEGHRTKQKNINGEYSEGIYIPGSENHKVYTGNKRRIYKGEGSITFIAYDPFARQLYKTLDLYTVNGYDNVNEWAESSGILSQAEYDSESFDIYQDISNPQNINYSDVYNGLINVYNPGDIDTPYILFIPYVNNQLQPASGSDVYISTDGAPDLIITPFGKKPSSLEENGVIINTRAKLIEGVNYDYNTKSWRLSGNIYNRYIREGSFGRIFKGNKFNFRQQGIYLNCLVEDNKPAIFYNYLYY